MAGRRRSKHGGSGDAGVGFLILVIIGLVVTYWKQILLLLIIVGIALCIYLVLKQIGKGLIERSISSRNSQQKTALPEPKQAAPEQSPSKYMEKPGGATRSEVNQQFEKTSDALLEHISVQTTPQPLLSAAFQAKDENHPELVPRPLPMNPEELEAKLRKLEEIIRS